MSAPLTSAEKAQAEQVFHASHASLATNPTVAVVAGAGALTLIGLITGSEHPIRNVLLGGVLGFGVSLVAATVQVSQAVSPILDGRRAKWATRQAELLDHA